MTIRQWKMSQFSLRHISLEWNKGMAVEFRDRLTQWVKNFLFEPLKPEEMMRLLEFQFFWKPICDPFK